MTTETALFLALMTLVTSAFTTVWALRKELRDE